MSFNAFKMDNATKLSLSYLTKWTLLAILAGIAGPLIVHSFVFLLDHLRQLIVMSGIPIWVWPAAGALLVGGIICRIEPESAGEGVPLYIQGMRVHRGWLDFSVTFNKFWAALLTLATYGSGGIVGPLGRVVSGLMSYIEGRVNGLNLGFDRHDQRSAAICGMAAAVGTIFHSSIGAGIFAVEIIQRKSMGYRDLFPAILSSASSVFVCKTLGLPAFYRFNTAQEFMQLDKIGWLVLLAVLAGATGHFYTNLYGWVSRIFRRRQGRVLLKVVFGSSLAFLIAWAVSPELLGTSRGLVQAIITDDLPAITGRLSAWPVVPVIVLVLFLKIIGNCLTVGSGMSAGFTGPAVIVGMLLGTAVSRIADVPFGTPTFFAFLSAGFAGLLASAMNVPLAAAVMAVEVFGIESSFPAGFAAIVGFQVTRHRTIYDYALEEFGIED